MGKKNIIIIVLIIFVILILFFFPKKIVIGGLGGFIQHGMIVYREEYDCFGFKYDYCQQCADCGCKYLCFGIKYNKKCYNEVAERIGIKKIETSCK